MTSKYGYYSDRKTNSDVLIESYRHDPCNAYSDGAPNAYHSFLEAVLKPIRFS